jgi:hypothetical protein
LGGSQTGRNTNFFLTVASSDLDFRSNTAIFSDHVRASLLEQDIVQGALDSDWLEVHFDNNNNIRSVAAQGSVRGEATPQPPYLKRSIACEKLSATFWPGSDHFLKTANGEGGVFVEQIEKSKRFPTMTKTARLKTDSVSALFAPAGNLVEHATALRNVDGVQLDGPITNILQGRQVDYDGGPSSVANVTGNPVFQYFGPRPAGVSASPASAPGLLGGAPAENKQTGILASGYDAMTWEIGTGSLHFKGTGTTRSISVPVIFSNTNTPPLTNR